MGNDVEEEGDEEADAGEAWLDSPGAAAAPYQDLTLLRHSVWKQKNDLYLGFQGWKHLEEGREMKAVMSQLWIIFYSRFYLAD